MILTESKRKTLDDLHRVEGKAELVGGRIIHYMSTGRRSGRLSRLLVLLMSEYLAQKSLEGEVFGDNVGFAVPELRSGRESFSPDAAYFGGPEQDDDMDFVQGPPTFAIEIRSKDGYGPRAEQRLAEKRADYFEAGTKTVWDIDTKSECIYAYSISSPVTPLIFRRGDVADAEPGLPGWRIEVNRIFDAIRRQC